MRETTEIRIEEDGDETHESWLLIGANRVSASAPGVSLFDSDIHHQHFVSVRVTRCTRKRDLNRDWLHPTENILEMSMSMAQWGAFVSSFGGGAGVPATLDWLTAYGAVPRERRKRSRLEESHAEVLNAGEDALAPVAANYQRVMDAFERGGKRDLREALRSLGYSIENAPKNMEFAAQSLTEHAENVVTKARSDIEAMARSTADRPGLAQPDLPRLRPGDE